MLSALSLSITLTFTAFAAYLTVCFLAEINLKSYIFSGSRNDGSRDKGVRSFLGVDRSACRREESLSIYVRWSSKVGWKSQSSYLFDVFDVFVILRGIYPAKKSRLVSYLVSNFLFKNFRGALIFKMFSERFSSKNPKNEVFYGEQMCLYD